MGGLFDPDFWSKWSKDQHLECRACGKDFGRLGDAEGTYRRSQEHRRRRDQRACRRRAAQRAS